MAWWSSIEEYRISCRDAFRYFESAAVLGVGNGTARRWRLLHMAHGASYNECQHQKSRFFSNFARSQRQSAMHSSTFPRVKFSEEVDQTCVYANRISAHGLSGSSSTEFNLPGVGDGKSMVTSSSHADDLLALAALLEQHRDTPYLGCFSLWHSQRYFRGSLGSMWYNSAVCCTAP